MPFDYAICQALGCNEAEVMLLQKAEVLAARMKWWIKRDLPFSKGKPTECLHAKQIEIVALQLPHISLLTPFPVPFSNKFRIYWTVPFEISAFKVV